ncbi:MAG: transporter substrate-binding domain-containing protein [bacterium]
MQQTQVTVRLALGWAGMASATLLVGMLATAMAAEPGATLPPGAPTPLSGAPLRIGMAPNYPPLAFEEKGVLKGIEVDFAKRLGPALGRPIELIETKWENLAERLEEKKIDMIMSGTSITEERKKRVSFTESYLEVGQMAIVREDDFLALRDPAAMDRPSMRVGVISRTTGEAWARKHLKKAKLHGYANTEEGVEALKNNQIDYFIQDAPAVWRVTGGFMNENQHLKGLYRPLTKEQLAWAVRKDDPALLKQLNVVLEKWKKDGTLDDVLDDWITVRKTSIEVKPAHE